MPSTDYDNFFSGYSIIACAIKTHDEIFFLLQKDGQDPDEEKTLTRLLAFSQKKWSLVEEFEGLNLVSMDFIPAPESRLLLVDEYGDVISYKNNRINKEKPIPGSDECYTEYLKNLRTGGTFAVGSERHIWKREGEDRWQAIHQSTHTPDIESKDGGDMGFQTLDGFDDKDVYVSGYAGDTWRYNGTKWLRVDIPSNSMITSICCASNGSVYMGGNMGKLLVGRDDQWQIVESEILGTRTLDCFTEFQGEIFFSTSNAFFCIDKENQVSLVEDIMPIESFTVGVVDSNEHILVACGGRKVRIYDGVDWRQVVDYERLS